MNDHQDKTPRSAPNMLWLIVIALGVAMLAGGFAGYNGAAAAKGEATFAPWIGPLVALAVGAIAFGLFVRRHGAFWQSWSPRKRLYWVSLALSAGLGLVTSFLIQAGQTDVAGDALFGNGPIAPNIAIGIAALWIVGMAIALPIYHRSIDDHERLAYYRAGLAGFYAFVLPCPAWWVLARADLLPPVEAMPLFLLSIAANAIAYFWFKFR